MESAIRASAEKELRNAEKTQDEMAAAAKAAAKEQQAKEEARRVAAAKFKLEKEAMRAKLADAAVKKQKSSEELATQKTAMAERLKRLAEKEVAERAEQKATAEAKKELMLARRKALNTLSSALRLWFARRRWRRRKAAIVLQTHFRARFLATRLRISSMAAFVLILDGCRAAHIRALRRRVLTRKADL